MFPCKLLGPVWMENLLPFPVLVWHFLFQTSQSSDKESREGSLCEPGKNFLKILLFTYRGYDVLKNMANYLLCCWMNLKENTKKNCHKIDWISSHIVAFLSSFRFFVMVSSTSKNGLDVSWSGNLFQRISGEFTIIFLLKSAILTLHGEGKLLHLNVTIVANAVE